MIIILICDIGIYVRLQNSLTYNKISNCDNSRQERCIAKIINELYVNMFEKFDMI